MVIASIDIQDGAVVQLRQGKELVLTRDNPPALAEAFDRYGEVAVIDLNAAKNTGNNRELLVPLLRKARCRVGGGVKTPEQARELVSMGACKIIVGSKAFRTGGAWGVNTDFLAAMGRAVGKERLIAAVDARDRGIVVDGWKTATGLDLVESARAVEPFVSEILFTCVEREGTMTGIDREAVRALRTALSCGLTVAGGVSTHEEIEALGGIGCNVQIGMALYTGAVSLAEGFVRSLNWSKDGSSLLPVIAQSPDRQVVMTGFTDRTALRETFRRGSLCFHSRTRDALWMKGETSGNTLKLIRIRADCDRDALLATVEPAGPVCHTGGYSCFDVERRYTPEFLQSLIAERFRDAPEGSYTATLDDALVRRKVMEEAYEVCSAKSRREIVWEASDLLFFLTALITRAGIPFQEVLDELDRRHKK
ncbi:MAG: phosphoribosyl-ATP diphosphatase [Spirochaetaceae bacterium]|jgi:phosphoribosyl-ATP pyrophosphohydrolase/phosphoribosyl-AMP cyclohydrolase|nr:phosphoribosyl-ATP diphosphatase [Spirochaetaceae bacterium]